MRGVLFFGWSRALRDALMLGAALGVAAACGDDTVVGRRPSPTKDAAAPDGQAGSQSANGGSSGVGGAPNGGTRNGGASNGGGSNGGASAGNGGAPTRTPCTNSLACDSNQVCDQAAGFCVDCVTNADCTTTGASFRCVGQHCRAPCTSDRQCTPQGLLCNVPLGVCTECVRDTDCGASAVCQVGNCIGVSPPGSGGVANGGAGGVSTGGVSNGGAGGVSNGGAAGSGGAGPLCNRADLWLALDQSGSMGNAYDTGTRWQVFQNGVQGFATTATRAAAGIVMFPKMSSVTCCTDADCGSNGPCTFLIPLYGCPTLMGTCGGAGCGPGSYDNADVPLTPLPDTGNVFAPFLASVAPGGSSTIAPALERMRTRAVASATANPLNKTAIVLVTDGAPGGCTANTVPDIANIAAAALAGSPSLKTYVITIGIDPTTMESVATAGGTTIFGIPTTAAQQASIDYVKASLLQIANDVCK